MSSCTCTVPAGVVRDKVGDILVQGETGAQILVDPELVEHFEQTLTQVRMRSHQQVRVRIGVVRTGCGPSHW